MYESFKTIIHSFFQELFKSQLIITFQSLTIRVSYHEISQDKLISQTTYFTQLII
ncbi:hypothetical protein GW891_03835 [bacterium]|nr:hypothetical protein [bacterium]